MFAFMHAFKADSAMAFASLRWLDGCKVDLNIDCAFLCFLDEFLCVALAYITMK